MVIETLDALRRLCAASGERAQRKQIAVLDAHCRRFEQTGLAVSLESREAMLRRYPPDL